MECNNNNIIVDDDAEFAGMVAEAVRDVSDTYTVQVSTDAQAAIAEIQGTRASVRFYDLVITDIKMPGSSGLQLLKTLSEIAPGTKTITMTAYHSPELASQAEQLHVHAYLIKPIALSEFRRVVRAALSSPKAGLEAPPLSSQLSAAQKTAIERRLANLRATTNSMAALLVHVDSTILAIDSLKTDMDADTLCEALIDAQQTIEQALRHALSTDTPIQQSYYGTETCGICTYRLDNSHVLVAVFGPTVREGHVWYCMRETAAEVANALAAEAQDKSALRADAGNNWRREIEQYFTDTSTGNNRSRRPARTASASVASTRSAATPPAEQPTAIPRTDVDPNRTLAAPESPRLAPDQINWDIPTTNNWDQVVADTGRTFEGIDLEEAQARGLYSLPPSDTSAAENTERPSVDDIDWDISADLDWDRIVADTDQGFAGMDFEEAKKQGIIDDLEPESSTREDG